MRSSKITCTSLQYYIKHFLTQLYINANNLDDGNEITSYTFPKNNLKKA